jgi:hypothetical protein
MRAFLASLASWRFVSLLLTGCVSANVVVVDRKTALEQQASGSFRGLEEELEQAGLLPRPEPLTAAQLEEAGVARAGETAELTEGVPDSLLSDALLTQRCVGEALDGTLVLTVASCTGTIDVPHTNRLIERVNRNRRQLWQWLAEKGRGGKTPEQVQVVWRKQHLTGLVCGGQVQKDDTSWEVKRC